MTILRTRTRLVMVDDAIHPFGRMLMCHMFSRDHEALLAMARRIGVAEHWLQQPPKASWVHFDISKGKRELAIRHGAIAVDRYECVLIAAEQKLEVMRKLSGVYGPEVTEAGELHLQKKREMVATCRVR